MLNLFLFLPVSDNGQKTLQSKANQRERSVDCNVHSSEKALLQHRTLSQQPGKDQRSSGYLVRYTSSCKTIYKGIFMVDTSGRGWKDGIRWKALSQRDATFNSVMVRETLMWFQDKGSSEKQSFCTKFIFSRLILEIKETWNKTPLWESKGLFSFPLLLHLHIMQTRWTVGSVCVRVCVLEAEIASGYSYRLSMSLVKRTLLPYLMQLHVDLIR